MDNIILGGRYQIIEKIGEGGMSEVYKAKCTKLNRNVAVKILKKEFCENQDISNKFRKEAEALAKLSESNIVNVLDVGSEDDIEYFVMEFVDGKTLKDIIRYHGKFSYQTAIKVGLQIAKGLECAHKNNIVHRDVKPQNILVNEEGEVKITDFGIAKSTTSSTITNTQTIVGSAHYFSPEQAKGSFVDCRSDIYSLGVVLYEMVTGVLPFEGESPVTIALKHIQDMPIAPKNLNKSIPESLNRIILKCMEKDASARYKSMKELSLDLQKVQENPDTLIQESQSKIGDDRTIVMPVINENSKSFNKVSKSLEDEYYEEDEDEEEEEDEDDKSVIGTTKNKKKLITGGVVSILVIMLFLLGFFMFGKATRVKKVNVPNIIDMNRNDAKAQLEKLNLVYTEVFVDDESEKPEGTILRVDPKVGEAVNEGTEIKVTVAAGLETYEMPELKEYTRDSIEHWFKNKGITDIEIEEVFSEDVEKDKVISQEPKAGEKITKNSSVKVVISKGKEIKKNKVPDLIGKSESEALEELKKLNFNPKVNYEITDVKEKDKIVLLVDNVGIELPEGTTIAITVNKFEINPSKYISKGATLGDAEHIFSQFGINVKVVNEDGDRNTEAKITNVNTKSVGIGGTVEVETETKKINEPPKTDEVQNGANTTPAQPNSSINNPSDMETPINQQHGVNNP